jgi:hypothetical protein
LERWNLFKHLNVARTVAAEDLKARKRELALDVVMDSAITDRTRRAGRVGQS